jgi:cytochrome b pre-mRNA-processing protein 3
MGVLGNALSMPPLSLEKERKPIKLPAALDTGIGKLLLSALGFYSRKSQLLHGSQSLYEAIKEQCDEGMVRAFKMDPEVFFSTYTLLSLHVWMIVNRLSARNDRDTKDFRQRFYNAFQNDVERRVHDAGVQIRVGKWLKQLEEIFYTSGIALDKVVYTVDGEGLPSENKETATDVINRVYFGGDEAKRAQAALLAKYVQRELRCLRLTDDEAIFKGDVEFSRAPFQPFRGSSSNSSSQSSSFKS